MKLQVAIKPCPDCGGFTAWCPELPGCFSEGETKEEALANFREAACLFFEDCGDGFCEGFPLYEVEL